MDFSGVAARLARFRAATADGQQRALRVPRERVYRTPGEMLIPAARLQEQERAMYELLNDAGLPAPRPISLVEEAESGLPVLVSSAARGVRAPRPCAGWTP